MDNWHNIRGSKLQKIDINKNIDFNMIHKKILMVVDLQIKRLNPDLEEYLLPNKYGHWVIK